MRISHAFRTVGMHGHLPSARVGVLQGSTLVVSYLAATGGACQTPWLGVGRKQALLETAFIPNPELRMRAHSWAYDTE